jgi:phthiocerol/phenolphthiocerol synthesis type-I polyketide synthase E
MKSNQYSGFEVAVVGMSIRTSEAANWREFWRNLILSKESFQVLSEEALMDAGMEKSFINDKNYVNCSRNILNKDSFDSKFFGYSHDEAKMMYPAHRFFHECVWEALEDAGYIPETINEPVGIYAGAGDDILWKSFVSLSAESRKVNNFYLNKINNKDYLTTLVSYKLGFTGPSMTINTACSTSLVAIHTACKALIFGETKMALAGASSIINDTQKGYIYEEGSIFSKDGHCRAFDKDSTGTVDGEGTGVVVLKRLKDAIEDKDHIYAIIKGSAINNDGNKKVGYTAPSIEGQVACIKTAQKFSRVNPETISYVEAHGTGTDLGDSIEVEALNSAFNNNKNFSCPIGSVKTNIGHLDTAAGVAGFIKTVLSIKNRIIPASLHFNEANPNINFNEGPFYVNKSLSEWKTRNNDPIRAAVNSFGVGGTNAHVILEEAPSNPAEGSVERNFKLLVVSAKTETSLNNYFIKLSAFLKEETDINLSDMCYTYQVGRQNFSNRISFSFQNKNELLKKIEENSSQKRTFSKVKSGQITIVFAFPGQGSQYINMGKDLYQSNLLFKTYMDKGFDLLEKLTNQDFKEILYPEGAGEINRINDTSFAQPIIFLTEYSLAKVLIDYGIQPSCMIGHSIGEYAAACISGLFTFEQALKLVIKRGNLMNGLPGGAMISVPIDELQAQQFINPEVSLAAVNGPKQIVLSGNDNAIEKVTEKLTAMGIPAIKLHTSHAFHSAMQDPILEEFKNEFKDIQFGEIGIPFISNPSGDFIQSEDAISAEYWAKQLRNTVRFSKGVNNLLSDPSTVFIEVGAGNALISLIKQHKSANDIKLVNVLRAIKNQENDEKYFLDNLGLLWSYGIKVKWSELYKNEERFRIPLPTYAFDNLKYQSEIDHTKLFNNATNVSISDLENSFYFPSWKRSLLSIQNVKAEKTFLVFSDRSEYSTEIIEKIIKTNNSVIEVVMGESYIRHSSSLFSVDPLDTRHYNQLFQSIETEGTLISNIIYLWALTVNSSAITLAEENLEFHRIYFCLTKIVSIWKNETDKNIFIFTNLLHSVIGNEAINYKQSLLLGLLKVMPIENQIRAVNVDIDVDAWNTKLAEQLVAEILNEDMLSDRIISYRSGRRWIQEFQKSLQNLSSNNTSLKKGGTYLVTGGLGNLGFLISKHLISEHQANVILLGRKKLNELGKNKLYEKRYTELKKLNDNVIYLDADVSVMDDIKECVLLNSGAFNAINGIIHLAGNVNDNDLEFIENSTFEKTLNMLAPKLKGVENLHEIFGGYKLDFIWLSSSLAATFGGIQLGAYATANSYLNHFTFSKSGVFKCVELPQVDFEGNIPDKQRNTLSEAELITVFESSLNMDQSNVIFVSKEDISKKLIAVLSIQNTDSNGRKSVEKTERPNLQTSYQLPQTDIERKLKSIFEDYFEITDIGVNDDFFELGGDSLRAMVFLKKITKEFDIQIPLRDFFSNKTISKMANFIEEKKWLAKEVSMKNEITI